jgi:hypothetical protein
MECMGTMDIVSVQVIKPEHTGGYSYEKFSCLKKTDALSAMG